MSNNKSKTCQLSALFKGKLWQMENFSNVTELALTAKLSQFLDDGCEFRDHSAPISEDILGPFSQDFHLGLGGCDSVL